MKKLLSLLMAFILCIFFSAPAFAANKDKLDNSHTVYEYDIYVTKRAEVEKKLAFGVRSIDENSQLIYSNAIENELLRISELPTEELRKRGYNAEQINILQNYDGERIETNSELRSVLANITYNFIPYQTTSSRYKVGCQWTWNQSPIFSGNLVKDAVGVRWQGVDSNSHGLQLQLNSGLSSCVVDHYTKYNTFVKSVSETVMTENGLAGAYSYITMSLSNQETYAKTGILTVTIDVIQNPVIELVEFYMSYGHWTLTANPTVTMPLNDFTINFSLSMQKMSYLRRFIDKNGYPYE